MTEHAHDNLEADLSAYLDGELPPARAAQVERALSKSAELRQRLNDLRAIADGLADLPRPAAPAALSAAVTRELTRRAQRRSGSALRHWMPFVLWPAGAAAVILLAFWVWRAPAVTGRAPDAAPAELAVGKALDTLAKRGESGPAVVTAPRAAEESGEVAGERHGLRDEPASTARDVPVTETLRELAFASTREPADADGDGVIELGAPVAPESRAAHWSESPAIIDGYTSVRESGNAVEVTVVANDPRSYEATNALLGEWGQTDGARESVAANTTAPAEAGAAAVVERTIEIPADELRARLIELNERAPAQVHVTMNFVAADDDLLAQVAAPAPEPTAASYYLRYPGGDATKQRNYVSRRLGRFGQTRWPEMAAPTTSPVAAVPSAADAETKSAPATPPGEFTGRSQVRAPAAAAPLTGRSAATSKSRLERDFLDRRDAAVTRRELDARHRAATEEPEIIFVEPPAEALRGRATTGPAEVAGGLVTSAEDAGAGAPLPPESNVYQRMLNQMVQQQLDRAAELQSAGVGANETAAVGGRAGQRVNLVIRVLPPPAPTTQGQP